MKKTFILAVVTALLALHSPAVKAEEANLCVITEMYIAGLPAKDIQGELQVPQDWLEDGELVIEGQASKHVEKVEVTLDGGKTWKTAQGTSSWFFSIQPLPKENFKIAARTWCQGKPAHPYRRRFYKVSYVGKTSRAIIEEVFHKIELYYQGKNRLQIMKLFSRRLRSPLYSNYRELEVQIRNDFQWGSGMDFHFYIDQVLKSENIYIVQTHWDLTYLGLLEPKHGYTEFHFDSGNEWKIVDIRGDKPFGIVEEPKPDLEIAGDEIQGTFQGGYPTGTVIVPVHNNGRIAARKVAVKVYCKDNGGIGYPPASATQTKTIKVVPIMSVQVVTFTMTASGGGLGWFPPVTCTITVDPQNRISELNEENNTAEVTF